MIGPRTVAVLCTLSFCLFAAGDPFSGAWKLNPSKSKLPPPLPRSQTVRIKADSRSIRIREEVVDEKGKRLTVTVNARFDGKDYPVTGTPFADAVAYQRLDSHTLKGTVKKAGKIVTSETATISADGKTLTGTYSGTDATGKHVDATAVLERQ
ncbi:MAG: hypothetical protein ABSG26_17115 [Bryobacteraceae bacterium]|jgi:hypothetical protein